MWIKRSCSIAKSHFQGSIKMFKLSVLATVLLALSAAAALPADKFYQQLVQGDGPSVNPVCVAEHCAKTSAKCITTKECGEAISCSGKCFADWDKDPSSQKFIVQNCTNKCVFTYGENDVFQNFMGCLTDNKCITFPPIPKTCKAPNIKPTKKLSVKDLNGTWWVQRGYHKVYDCYPCQKIIVKPINETAWNYTPQYETYLVNNSLWLVNNQHFIMPNTEPGAGITFTYHDVGLDHSETWWLLNKADDDSWLQLYYCGNTAQWNYEGSLVLARAKKIDQAAYPEIAKSYMDGVGLDLKEFCYTDTSSDCMNG